MNPVTFALAKQSTYSLNFFALPLHFIPIAIYVTATEPNSTVVVVIAR
jgi:hypothetical protein